MPTVTCPSCGEKGTIPAHFVGTRIKCRKCGVGFVVTGRAPKAAPTEAVPAAAAAATPAAAPVASALHGDLIAVEGLDETSWPTAAVAHDDHEHDHDHHATPAFDPHHEPEAPASHGAIKHYKLLTQKDKYFEGKFDLVKLETALNHFAREGWVVRSMTSSLVASFTGEKEELVILLER